MTVYSAREILIIMLGLLSLVDIKKGKIPKWVTILCLIIGFLKIGQLSYVLNVTAGFILLFTVSVILRRVFGIFGGVDMRTSGLICGCIGILSGLYSLSIALVLMIGFRVLLWGDDRLPFVPFLLLGVWIIG